MKNISGHDSQLVVNSKRTVDPCHSSGSRVIFLDLGRRMWPVIVREAVCRGHWRGHSSTQESPINHALNQ